MFQLSLFQKKKKLTPVSKYQILINSISTFNLLYEKKKTFQICYEEIIFLFKVECMDSYCYWEATYGEVVCYMDCYLRVGR